MSAITNLDAMIPEPRYITIGGEQHEILPLTLEQFALAARVANAMGKMQDGDLGEEDVEMVYRFIEKAIPSLDMAFVRRLNVFIIQRIVAEINATIYDAMAKAGGDEGEVQPPEVAAMR